MSDRYQSLSTQRILRQRARKRAEKTNLDYLVTAFSPVLIMLLVGSLVFFLIHVFYRGEMAGGIRWVMFWFVLAIVLVARIGIEQSSTHATIYGAGLAVATWLFLIRTHPAFLLGIVLLAVVWWSADRLVKDCTLIHEDADSSGSGLLQQHREETPQKCATKNRPSKKDQTPSEKQTSKHSPGRWILYYSLAALPLFGLGQLFTSFGNPDRSESGFNLLIVYLLAAAGLLLTTSFLGLRRYLRQRSITMPNGIAAQWVLSGGKIAAIVFLLALAVPRPGVSHAWAGLSESIDHTIQSASKLALKFNPSGTSEGTEGNQTSNGTTAEGETGRDQSTVPSQSAQTNGTDHQSNRSGRAETASNSNGSQTSTSAFARALVYGVLILVTLWILIRYRREWITILHAMWQALLRLFASRNQPIANSSVKEHQHRNPPQRRPQPFHRFKNPFVTGKAARWSAEDLVVYTFEALQAWAEKEGTPPQDHLTPVEQTGEWSMQHPFLGENALILGRLYSQLAYQNRLPTDYHPGPLKSLWASLTETTAEV